MKKTMLLLGVCALLSGCERSTPKPVAVGEFQPIELDLLIAQEKEAFQKFNQRKMIRKADPIWFSARVMQAPEVKENSYIYQALQMAEVNPVPSVTHQLFVGAPSGQVISVYVEEGAAKKISETIAVGQSAYFFGYHMYTYKNGPAFLIVDALAEDK